MIRSIRTRYNFNYSVIVIFFLIQLVLAGCEKKVLPPQANPLRITFIDEPIVFEMSDTIQALEDKRPDYVFDLSDVPLVKSGNYNEFFVIYDTPSSCEEDVFLYNNSTRLWDQIAFSDPINLICLDIIGLYSHLGSAHRLCLDNYLSADTLLKLHARVYNPELQVLKLNPNYYAVPMPLSSDNYGYVAITSDGPSLWLTGGYLRPGKVYNLARDGRVLQEFEMKTERLTGIAYGDGSLWLTGAGYHIYKMSAEGDIVSEFDVAQQLYFVNRVGISPQVFVIDPFASCTTGQAVITDTIILPRNQGRGLAWDGENLIFVSWDSLYWVSITGEVLDVLESPVSYPADAAWDGETIWILNRGPQCCPSADQFISRFKLR
jgi:hypothetical protein